MDNPFWRDTIEALERRAAVIDNLKSIVAQIDKMNKRWSMILSKIHTVHSEKHRKEVLFDSMKMMGECGSLYEKKLHKMIPKGSVFKYHFIFRDVMHQSIYLSALHHYAAAGFLITYKELCQYLFLDVWTDDQKRTTEIGDDGEEYEGPRQIPIDIEDYLNGILLLPSELARWAVNAVALNDLSIPSKISSFLNEFYQCSQLLTLKNDGLRRKFDSIKYDVKKVEGVVYDLAVRGLVKGSSKAL